MLGFLRVFARSIGVGWIGYEEGVLLVACGMLLGDEEGIEVPEAGLDVSKKLIKQ